MSESSEMSANEMYQALGFDGSASDRHSVSVGEMRRVETQASREGRVSYHGPIDVNIAGGGMIPDAVRARATVASVAAGLTADNSVTLTLTDDDGHTQSITLTPDIAVRLSHVLAILAGRS